MLLAATTDQPDNDTSFDEAALHGLVVFTRLTAAAQAHGLPMILDY